MAFGERSIEQVDSTGIEGSFGQVLSCRGSEVRIGLAARVPLGEQRATVGKFVAIRSGASVLVGMIAEVNADSTHAAAADYRAVARVDLMGEIVQVPQAIFASGAAFETICDRRRDRNHRRSELAPVYSSGASRSIAIDLNQDASIQPMSTLTASLTKHFAVLGSTGVGKSSSVAVLGELIKVRPDVRILLLDVHNEYGKSFGDDAAIIGAHNLKLPFGCSISRR